ncbi:MAG: response regulator [Frondihabitans sp.]|nr:response regulator [Frondihabitans sp.]
MKGTVATDIRVLVVEDSDDHRGLLKVYFEKAGCIVEAAATAEEAIVAYADRTPELAVIDLVLPGMDGWELIKHLQRDVPTCAIAVTSVLDPWRFPIVHATLPKPFTRADVLQVLEDTVPRWERL